MCKNGRKMVKTLIKNMNNSKKYSQSDMKYYRALSWFDRFICALTEDPAYKINKYVKYLRREEYYYNKEKSCLNTILVLYYLRKKNSLGNKLGFKIPRNTIGDGLTIYHHGSIIVN